jgi:hypothetical protein
MVQHLCQGTCTVQHLCQGTCTVQHLCQGTCTVQQGTCTTRPRARPGGVLVGRRAFRPASSLSVGPPRARVPPPQQHPAAHPAARRPPRRRHAACTRGLAGPRVYHHVRPSRFLERPSRFLERSGAAGFSGLRNSAQTKRPDEEARRPRGAQTRGAQHRGHARLWAD